MSEQGTADWFNDRCGCATASSFVDIIAVSKATGKPLKAREDYLWKVATERLYESPTEAFNARSTDWGKDLEPFACQAYEVETGNFIIPSGFVRHPTIAYCGGSPDGLVETVGGIEIKCPKDRRVHMQTWRDGMPPDHLPQVQGNIWINGREWFDFISYDPRAPERFRLYIERIYRNDKYILALQSHVTDFLNEVDQLVRHINAQQVGNLRNTNLADGGADHEDMRSEPSADVDGVLLGVKPAKRRKNGNGTGGIVEPT